MTVHPPPAVLDALRAWALPVVIGAPLPSGTTSRTWHAVHGVDRAVLKVVADRSRYVLPGLAVAAELARRGIETGPPLPAGDGSLGLEVELDGAPATVCLLRFEAGAPVDVSITAGARAAGRLLAQVHDATLRSPMPTVPNRLLEWFDGFLPSVHSARTALTQIRQAEPMLTSGVIYGDPAPEVLVDDSAGTVALIDWGTPSFGPVAYDVATWLNWMARRVADARLGRAFLASYEQIRRLPANERALLPLLRELAAALPVE